MMRSGSLRIAHVNDIAFVAGTLAAAQRQRGDHAEVFEAPKPGAARGPLLKWLLSPVRALGLAYLAARLRLGRWDIVHVHYASHSMVGAWSGRPYVVHCHGSDVRGVTSGSVRGRLLARYLRRAALVLYSTPDLREWVTPYRPDARFLPNPIDIDLFTSHADPTTDVLLGVRLDPIKGAQTAIETTARLLAVRPATSVTVIEQGPLVGLARQLLAGRARFIAPVAHPDLPAVLADHRVVLGQFRLGILSQLELEAMACGVLVVAQLGYPDVFADAPPIAPADDADAALEAVVDGLDQPPAAGNAARELRRSWVVASHGAPAVADALTRLYRGMDATAEAGH